jgi:ketosteroid isomerase-like protein
VTTDQLWQLSVGYASAVDRRDGDALVAVFTPEATVTVVPEPGSERPERQMAGTAEIAQIAVSIARYERTFHFLGQSSYDVGPGSATGEVYCVAHHLKEGQNLVMYIRYADKYRQQTDGSWLICDRRVVVDWSERRPVG